ncbi:MAG: TetR/AcrR family transcriptional regulator [Propionibacteriaceae bacterium]|nr:TetR/AcrR family transcriptional regulator [Propionibacteriaceae bacterium]
MPTPSRTSLDAIVAAGRAVLAREGISGLTMRRVGEAVGVRAPSLYKHVPSRSALIRLVAQDLVADIARQLDDAANAGDPRQALRAVAFTLRAFALSDPHGFDLLFTHLPADAAPDTSTFASAVGPVLRVATDLAGPDHALDAARTLTAWASGFLRMELSGDFQLGGDVPGAFEFGLQTLIAGLECRQT